MQCLHFAWLARSVLDAPQNNFHFLQETSMAQLMNKLKRAWLAAFPPEPGEYRFERGLVTRARKS